MLWSEPYGDDEQTTVTALSAKSREISYDERFGERIWTKIRWFVVVRPGYRTCGCL